MTEQPKKLSRRDAIKVLGAAAGASVLATLPTKWTKPEITAGVLPAHAQTSWPYSFASCLSIFPSANASPYVAPLVATITPPAVGISLNLAIANINGVTVNTDASGTYQTNNAGQAVSSNWSFTGLAGDSITLEWTFVGNPQATPCQSVVTFA